MRSLTAKTTFLLLVNASVGFGQTIQWVTSAGGPAGDVGYGIAIDAEGNAFTTGDFAGDAQFGPIPLIASGSSDIFVMKQDPTGEVLWAVAAGGPHHEHGAGIDIDAAGNSYVVGSVGDPAIFGNVVLEGGGAVLAKYDGQGNLQWVRNAPNGTAYAVAVDNSGDVCVVGRFDGIATFDEISIESVGSTDVFVAKYNTDGTLLWVRSAGGVSQDEAFGVAVDQDGNIVVTGWHRGATFGPIEFPIHSANAIFVTKYDPAGEVLWADSIGPVDAVLSNVGHAIAVNSASNIYVTGHFGETTTFGTTLLESSGNLDTFVVKYSPTGSILWAIAPSATASNEGYGVAVDSFDNVLVGGWYQETMVFGNTVLQDSGGYDAFAAKIDTNGNVLGAWAGGGEAWDGVRGVAVDGTGNGYAVGGYGGPTGGPADFGEMTVESNGSNEIFVFKVSSFCGNGTVDAGEDCDDPNGNGPIGCSYADCACTANCKLPSGIVPAVSEWGLLATVLIGLTAGTVLFSREKGVTRR